MTEFAPDLFLKDSTHSRVNLECVLQPRLSSKALSPNKVTFTATRDWEFKVGIWEHGQCIPCVPVKQGHAVKSKGQRGFPGQECSVRILRSIAVAWQIRKQKMAVASTVMSLKGKALTRRSSCLNITLVADSKGGRDWEWSLML